MGIFAIYNYGAKRLIATVVAIAATISAMATAVPVGGLKYSVNHDGTCIINGTVASKISGPLTIPSRVTVGGRQYTVTAIDSYAFTNQPGITELTIPSTVTTIGTEAFRNCSSIEEVTIPASVTFIGERTFTGCSSLRKIVLEDGPQTLELEHYYNLFYHHYFFFTECPLEEVYLGRNLHYLIDYNDPFRDQTNLKEVKIGPSVTSIGSYSFYDCPNLATLEIANSVTEIGPSAFSNATSLTKLHLPQSVTKIGAFAFSGCTELADLTLPGSVTLIGEGAFFGCTSLPSVSIPNSVKQIDPGAFFGCKNIKQVHIGQQVDSIGSHCFNGIDEEATVYVSNPSPAAIDHTTFPEHTINLHIYVPEDSLTAFQEHYYWCRFENLEGWNGNSNIRFARGTLSYLVTSTSNHTVELSLTPQAASRAAAGELVIPASVTHDGTTYTVAGIAASGFENAEISNLTLPGTIEYVGETTFKGVYGMERLRINSVTPPAANPNSFDLETYFMTILEVPQSAVAEYQRHAVWGQFFVQAIPANPTAIDNVAADRTGITVENGCITVPSGESAEVYSLSGILVASTARNGQIISGLPHGVYVVRLADKSVKVSL